MKKTFLTMLAATLCATATALPQRGDKVQLQLLETSDVHGSFFPHDFITGKPLPGSMARISHYVDSLRKACPDQVILLDNGDILQGRPVSYYYNFVAPEKENIAASVINYMKFDAQSYGNHDIEAGHKVYDKWADEVNCPSLGANMLGAAATPDGLTVNLQPEIAPYTIVERSGVKVAVLGLITPAIPNWLDEKLWSGLKFQPMVESARYWVDYIKRNEKPDVIAGLFHSGYMGGITTDTYSENAAAQVAREVPGFDVIFCGHDHRRNNTMDEVCDGSKVLVLNPANNAMALAQATISLEYDGMQWHVTDRKGDIVDVRNTPVDQAFMQHFAAQVSEVDKWVNRPIGTLSKTIQSSDCFFGNSAFGDMILQLMLDITGADIAVSAPLQADAVLHKGNITVGNMFDLYRFENDLYVVNLTGKELHNFLEMSYDLWVTTMTSPSDHIMRVKEGGKRVWFEMPTYNFDSAMGIDYEVDVTKPHGERVKILRMSNGQAFDENKTYRVAMNSYRANGGGELMTRGAGIPKEKIDSRIIYRSSTNMRTELMKAIEKQGTINPQPGSNWRFVPEKWTKPALNRDHDILFPQK